MSKHTPGPWGAHFEEAYYVTGPDRGRSGAIMLAEYDADCKLVGVAAAMVVAHGVEPDVWYELRGGEITRCDDQQGGAA